MQLILNDTSFISKCSLGGHGGATADVSCEAYHKIQGMEEETTLI